MIFIYCTLYLTSKEQRRDERGVEVRHAQQLQVQCYESQRTCRDGADYTLQEAHAAASAAQIFSSYFLACSPVLNFDSGLEHSGFSMPGA